MLTDKVMKEHKVDKAKAFIMLYKEGKPVYDALPAAEKKTWEEKAEVAKAQFQEDMKEWKSSNKDKENASPSKGKAGKKGGDKGPKRPLGAYPMWIAENRPMLTEKVMKEHSVDKAKAFLMLYKEGKSVYDARPAAEKKKYEDKAAAAKVTFKEEVKKWKANTGGNVAASAEVGGDDGEEDEEEEEEDEEDEE